MKKHPLLVLGLVIAVFAIALGCDQSFDELTGAISPVPEDGVVRGDELGYYFVFPQGWFERRATRDPEWDREFFMPEKRAAVYVLAHSEPEGTAYSINSFMRYTTDEAAKVYTDLRIIGRYDTSTNETVGRLWHASGESEGETWYLYCGLFVRYHIAVAIFAGAPAETFPLVRGEFEQIIKSFELETLRR